MCSKCSNVLHGYSHTASVEMKIFKSKYSTDDQQFGVQIHRYPHTLTLAHFIEHGKSELRVCCLSSAIPCGKWQAALDLNLGSHVIWKQGKLTPVVGQLVNKVKWAEISNVQMRSMSDFYLSN